MFFEGLEFGADGQEGVEDIGSLIDALFVVRQHLAGGGEFEATHLHQIMNEADLFNILFLILADLGWSAGLRSQKGELLFPVPERTLRQVKHLCHLLDGVVEFQVFVQIQRHNILFLASAGSATVGDGP